MEIEFWAYIAAWASLMGGIAALFTIADQAASTATKQAVTNWLRNVDPGEVVSGLPGTFAAMFDSVFGKRHWAWKCFYRSCIASSIASFISIALFYIFLFFKYGEMSLGRFIIVLSNSVFYFFINFVPDYVSLLETRFILSKIHKNNDSPKILFICLFFIVDLIITGIVGIGFSTSILAFIFFLDLGKSEIIRTSMLYLIPFAISGFLTSVWLWLYTIASIIVKAAYAIGVPLKTIRYVFDIGQKPILAVGVVACLFITAIFVVAGPFVLKF